MTLELHLTVGYRISINLCYSVDTKVTFMYNTTATHKVYKYVKEKTVYVLSCIMAEIKGLPSWILEQA